jgi:hypothetical protein
MVKYSLHRRANTVASNCVPRKFYRILPFFLIGAIAIGRTIFWKPALDLGTVDEEVAAAREAASSSSATSTATSSTTTTTTWTSSDCPPAKPYNATPGSFYPIWVASYPGSGSELFRKLILALTGLDGANYYDTPDRCRHYPATCKTHCPFLQKENCPMSRGLSNKKRKQRQKQRQKIKPGQFASNHTVDDHHSNNYFYYHDAAILLIRNPRNAIASYTNWRWEARRGVETHTQQAPVDFWKSQRNQEFHKLLMGWKQMITWWADPGKRQSAYHVSLVIPYERLIDPHRGPVLLKRLAEELQRAKIPVRVPADQFSCLWHTIVQAPQSSTKRTGHQYEPGYTKLQHDDMVLKLKELMETFSNVTKGQTTTAPKPFDLVQILNDYREDIAHNLVLDE